MKLQEVAESKQVIIVRNLLRNIHVISTIEKYVSRINFSAHYFDNYSFVTTNIKNNFTKVEMI